MQHRWIWTGLGLLAASAAYAQSVSAPGGFVPQQAVAFGIPGQPAVAVSPAHPLPTANRGVAVTYADLSGAIANGGTAQQLAVARPARQGFFIQNLSSGDLWINMAGPAVADRPALRIAPGQLYESPAHGAPNGTLSILGAATDQAFSAREW